MMALTYFLSLFPSASLYLCVSQWERQPGEAAVRAAAGGGLPAGWAGGTAGLIAWAPETAGLAETAEGGSGNAAGTSAHRGPKRVQQGARENDRYTIHTPCHPWLFSSKLFRVQISNTCHSPAGNAPRWHLDENINDLHCITALVLGEKFFFFHFLGGFLLPQKIWLAENWSRTCDTAKKYLPPCCGLWHQHFSIFQSADGLLLRDFVYINNLHVRVTQRNSVRESFRVTARGAWRSWKGSTQICVESLWQWRRLWVKSRCRRRCWRMIRPASLWPSARYTALTCPR